MRLWLLRSVRKAAKAASTFSLVVLAAVALAGPYTKLNERLQGVDDPKAAAPVLSGDLPDDPELQQLAQTVTSGGSDALKALASLKQRVEVGALAEGIQPDPKAAADAQDIKSSPLYHDAHVEQANWWSRAASQFVAWLRKLLPKQDVRPPGILAAPSLLGAWVIYLMWALLAGLVCLLAYIAIRHFRWQTKLMRSAKALLDEDEPERTADEWLEKAAALEQQGRFREAVRCLYLACLLRFDEARIARFDRGQTNWEHLQRIQASSNLPSGLDFRPATQAFDQIWYGMRVRGKDDVDRFRGWYVQVAEAVTRRVAA